MTVGAICPVATAHDTSGARRVIDANDPATGLLVAQVAPKMRRRSQLAQDLFAALGHRDDVAGQLRDAERDWELLIPWLTAWPITDLVLMDAQWLPGAMLDEAAGLAAVCGLRLWLVAQQPIEDAYPDALGRWPTAAPDPKSLARLIRAHEASDTSQTPGYPRVPAANFPSFRAEAARQLHPDAFATVDRLYRATYADSRSWLAELGSSDLTEDEVLGYLRPRLAASATGDEMVTIVRAVQAASFRAGWLLNAEPTQLILTAEAAAAAAISSPHTWERLRAYREPYRGAVCALAAAELGVDDMGDLRIADVAGDGSTVTLAADRQVEIPAGGHVFLRAQLTVRAMDGAKPDDLLFADADGTPLRRRMLALALRAALVELGVAILSQQAVPARLDPVRWAKRWGISVQRLA